MTFDPSEKRDQNGRWTRGGGDSGLALVKDNLDKRVLDVGGDRWNQETAERLEKEYAAVRPEIDKIAVEGVEKGASVSDADEEEEATGAPETWDALTGEQQEEAELSYKYSHIDQEKQFAHDNWADSGDPIYEAKHALAQDEDFKSEWLSEYLAEREEYKEPPLPFKVGDLLGAINIKAGDAYDDDPEITFDEKYLDQPDTLAPKEQMQLPGIQPQNGADFLTKEMRESIITSLLNKFNDEAKSKAEDIDPPAYLDEEAETNVQEAWGGMDEEEQFKYAMENVDSLKDAENVVPVRAPTSALAWPAEFDPLNTTSGMDYQRTQALAKYIADKRGAQLITERVGNAKWKPRDQFLGSDEDYKKLYEQPDSVGRKKDEAWTARMLGELRSADLRLWSGWKGSSTNAEGRLLQVAAAEELGGRIRDAKPPKPDDAAFSLAATVYHDPESTEAQKNDAQKVIEAAGMGVTSALVHAYATKYSATASFDEKKAAQAIIEDQKFTAPKEAPVLATEEVNGFTRLPSIKLEKNGAASTTVSASVANGWNGTTNNAPQGINRKESIDYANKAYAAIGGYEGVKAAVRAKWETTQYLLDKADIPVVQAYRGINYDHKLDGAAKTGDFNAPSSGIQVTDALTKTNLANYKVGETLTTQSGKIITKVSETGGHINADQKDIGKWKYSEPQTMQRRVVLRTEVPRTAVVSIPAYGVNVKSEQEVVVVGTGWKGWDAWSGRAPTFEEVPMSAQAKADKRAAA